MTNIQTLSIDPVRSLANGSIGATYTVLSGGSTTHPVRLVCFTNNTDGDMFFSLDGSTDQLFVGAGGFKLFDLNTNRLNVAQYWAIQVGTSFYVRYNTAPTRGTVYVECLWGN